MNYIIIVAGGRGMRMGSEIPKQFLLLKGKPILMHTIERFTQFDKTIKIILVLPPEQQDYWNKLCSLYNFSKNFQIADSGSTRFHSSKNGLKLIPQNTEGLVGIHDGVRPLVTVETIKRCYEEAYKSKAAIPIVKSVDSLRYITPDGKTVTVDRSSYLRVQTPQVFDFKILNEAYKYPYNESFTDDASVVENAGYTISTVEGNVENLKITSPNDLKIAEALFK